MQNSINIHCAMNSSGTADPETIELIKSKLTSSLAIKNLDKVIKHGFNELKESNIYICAFRNLNLVFVQKWNPSSYLAEFSFPLINRYNPLDDKHRIHTKPERKLFLIIEDPGHAWLEVPAISLIHLKIADKISSCSYISYDGKTAYLEEDGDMPVFVNATIQKGTLLDHEDFFARCTTEHQEHTFVRNLPHYNSKLISKS